MFKKNKKRVSKKKHNLGEFICKTHKDLKEIVKLYI